VPVDLRREDAGPSTGPDPATLRTAPPSACYFIRCCLNQFSAAVEAPWKPLT
jgi:hypothetical protein